MKINLTHQALTTSIITGLTVLTLATSQALANPVHHSNFRAIMAQHMGMGDNNCCNHSGMMYNPKTVETLRGKVVRIDTMNSHQGMSQGMGQGVHLTLQTANETISVHLGPSWYLDQQKLKINVGDEIEVTGSRINWQNNNAIMASKIKLGNTGVTLRDNNGVPVWRGQNRDNDNSQGNCCK